MAGMEPLVSVVIPAHDAGEFLRPAVLSALAAGRGTAEAVVVDDGSTDGSAEGLEALGATVVRRERGGEASARNAGVRAARGRFVTFLDADDLLEEAGLAPRVAALEADPAAFAVGGLPSALVGARGEVLAPVFERMAAARGAPFTLTLEDYRLDRFFPVSCSLYVYRREAFARAGLFDESLAAAPDADFHFRLLSLGGVRVLRVPAFARRLHGANMSLAGRAGAAPEFRPEIRAAIEEVNRRHGLSPAAVAPWEAEYL